jgi:ATP-dependent exoDNAse (exonuclease V) alpha subunit
MIGTRQMERVIGEGQKRGAKVVLVGDPSSSRRSRRARRSAIAERHGASRSPQVRRQREDWQRDATRQLATGRTATRSTAITRRATSMRRRRVIQRVPCSSIAGIVGEQEHPNETRLILTHTRDEVAELNALARVRLRERHELGVDFKQATSRGERLFASGDRIMFLRNERSLGVKNGSLGTVQSVSASAWRC